MEAHPELSVADATKRRWARSPRRSSPSRWCCCRCSCRSAFISGISGELFRQFAVTVARVDVAVGDQRADAVAGVVRDPAEAASRPAPRPDRHGHARHRPGARRLWRCGGAAGAVSPSSASRMVAVAASACSAWRKVTPTGFLPQDDQGAFFVIVQLPDGASRRAAPTRWSSKVEAILKRGTRRSRTCRRIAGLNFIDNYTQSNAAFMIVTLKPFEDRKDPSQTRRRDHRAAGGEFRAMPGGIVVPLAPPPIIGLGTGGGFTYVLQDMRGGDPKAMAQALRGLLVAANQDPQLTPGVQHVLRHQPVDLPRYRPRQGAGAGRAAVSVFQALQANLGGAYVNDINLFGRTWQVQVQAEAADRARRRHLPHQRAQRRRRDGAAAQPGRGAGGAGAAGADPLQQPPRGDDPGQRRRRACRRARRWRRWTRWRRARCRRAIAATGPTRRSRKSARRGRPAIILGFAMLFAYLFLVALYESWTIPVPVLLSVIGRHPRHRSSGSCSAA